MDGMIRSGSVGLRPKINTSMGKQAVENPNPVIPFTKAAIKYIPRIMQISLKA
jgi:hypothetical protein